MFTVLLYLLMNTFDEIYGVFQQPYISIVYLLVEQKVHCTHVEIVCVHVYMNKAGNCAVANMYTCSIIFII